MDTTQIKLTADALTHATETAKKRSDCPTKRAQVVFDFCNPRGAFAQYDAAHAQLKEAVDAGIAPEEALDKYDQSLAVQRLYVLCTSKTGPYDQLQTVRYGDLLTANAKAIKSYLSKRKSRAKAKKPQAK